MTNTSTIIINKNFTTTGFYSIYNARVAEASYRLDNNINNNDIYFLHTSFFLISSKGNHISATMVQKIKKYWFRRVKEHYYHWIDILFDESYRNDVLFKVTWDSVDSRYAVYYFDVHHLQIEFGSEATPEWERWMCRPPVHVSKLSHKYIPISSTGTGNMNITTVYDMILALEPGGLLPSCDGYAAEPPPPVTDSSSSCLATG